MQPVCVRGVAPRRFWRDGGFRRRFPVRDGGLGGRGAGLRRAAGRGTVGMDHGARSDALVGWLASLDAVHSVDLVGGPLAPRRLSGHTLAAELVRRYQAPGTVSRFILTVLDRVHGVGIVVASTGLCFQPVCVRGVAPRGFWRDGGFWRRFPGRDGGLGGRGAGLRRAAGRGAAGRDPVPRSGALAGCMASIDAVDSVDLVGEWRPARGRAKSSCCAPGG